MSRFAGAGFSRSELRWITLSLAIAQVTCAQGDDEELDELLRESASALSEAPKEGES